MKKLKLLIMLFVIIMSILSVQSVAAKNGDVIGKIYSTDIMAKIDGLNAPSYNIGGKTAIIIEELADKSSALNYAINFKYDDAQRRLDVTMSSSGAFYGMQYDSIKRGIVGEIAGDVYETDIKVYFNGYEIEGINIGGRTAVAIEDLGLVGGINAEFGYSKYRCRAAWKPEDRIIELDFIDNVRHFYTLDYGCSLKYNINDNVITAEFDRMANYNSEISQINYSQQFKNDVNVIKPLYFDDGKQKTEIGFMYLQHDTVVDVISEKLYITQPEKLKEVTHNMQDQIIPSAQQAFELLNDNINYQTLDMLETEDFYVVTVKLLNVKDNMNDIAYVLVKKTGGYAKIYAGSTYYKQREVKIIGENIISIGEGPTASPHGKPSMLYCELNLNNYFVK